MSAIDKFKKVERRRPSKLTVRMGPWFLYSIQAIDFRWGLATLCSFAEVPALIRECSRGFGLQEEDIRIGEHTEGQPTVVRFAVPSSDGAFAEGFAWKLENNGTTIVACSIELPWLDDVLE